MKGESYLREAKILFASGFPAESISYFTRALEHGCDPVACGLSRGAAYMARGMHRQAAEDFSRVLAIDAAGERAYYFRGVAFLALGEYENAVRDLTTCLSRNHDRGIAHLARGLAYAELGEERDAALDFSSASSFSSAEVDAFCRLFAGHRQQFDRTMRMLRRESAPWKTLLTREDARLIRSWFNDPEARNGTPEESA